MKVLNFIIFFSAVLTIYISVNYYIFTRGWQAIPKDSSLRIFYLVIFLVLSLSFIFGRVLEKFTICKISDACIWTGSFWLGMMLYFFLAAAILDILRLGNHILHFFPVAITANYERVKQITLITIITFASITVLIGHLNSLNPQIKHWI